MSQPPIFRDLRAFLGDLEAEGLLLRIGEPVSIVHETTELQRRVLADAGPALRFERPLFADGSVSPVPLVSNLFGTVERVARALGTTRQGLAALGELFAELREPRPPRGVREAMAAAPLARRILAMRPEAVRRSPLDHALLTGAAVDLGRLPIPVCWPGEAGPLLTWPVVVTRPPDSAAFDAYNLGVYRMQVIGRDRLIARWLPDRGGADHHAAWRARGEAMPIAVALGADPATLLAAAIPLPKTVSEIGFSGLLRRARPRLTPAATVPLWVPADAEFVLEGWVSPEETAPEGPFADHTGYYNSVESFPTVAVTAIRHRPDPLLLATYTARAPDEPAAIGEALNELFLPLVRRQFPEIVDCWFPPAAASYRMAVVTIRKRRPGQARRLMMGLWSMLPQFSMTKYLIVTDDDVNARDWADVSWAVATRSDPARDLMVVERTPIDYLDFASPQPGLGGKLGIDATRKIGAETSREWGEPVRPDAAAAARIEAVLARLGGSAAA